MKAKATDFNLDTKVVDEMLWILTGKDVEIALYDVSGKEIEGGGYERQPASLRLIKDSTIACEALVSNKTIARFKVPEGCVISYAGIMVKGRDCSFLLSEFEDPVIFDEPGIFHVGNFSAYISLDGTAKGRLK